MKLNELLGIEFPIIQGGMANIATGAFAAAVSNAGALGLVASGGMDAEALRADPAKFYKNMDRHGNTSAASIPVALNELAESGQLKPGQLLACIGFGGGLTWGGAIFQYKECV